MSYRTALSDNHRRTFVQDSPRKAMSSLQLFEDAKGLPPQHAILVRCLLCRAAYGGMTGDVELLKGDDEPQYMSDMHIPGG